MENPWSARKFTLLRLQGEIGKVFKIFLFFLKKIPKKSEKKTDLEFSRNSLALNRSMFIFKHLWLFNLERFQVDFEMSAFCPVQSGTYVP